MVIMPKTLLDIWAYLELKWSTDSGWGFVGSALVMRFQRAFNHYLRAILTQDMECGTLRAMI